MEKLYGLIGYPLSHSFSAGYFAQKFAKENIRHCRYQAFPLEQLSGFQALLAGHSNLFGLNVTIPYKETIIPYLDQLSETAAEIGAVNAVKIFRSDSKIYTLGYNTDVFGFEKSLETNRVSMPQKTLILGTGGASKAVEWVLKKHGCEVVFVSRKPTGENHISYEELEEISLEPYLLVVNTTPLGMHPDKDKSPPIPYHTAGNMHTFFDLIYNPAETLFLSKAKARNSKVINGMYMLEQQAEKAWEIWNKKDDFIF